MWMKKCYCLNTDGDQHDAVVAHRGDEVAVRIDEGDLRVIDTAPVLGGRALSLRIDGRMHLVHLSGKDNKGAVAATMRGRPVDLSVLDELHALALESLGAAGAGGTVSSDIPGLVVEIRVKEGQTVHQGDAVIVVEAMKMQNELAAGVAGTVVEIPVSTGDAINPGDPLVIIEPEPGGA